MPASVPLWCKDYIFQTQRTSDGRWLDPDKRDAHRDGISIS